MYARIDPKVAFDGPPPRAPLVMGLCVACGMGCGLPVARLAVPETLCGSYVGVVQPLASSSASGPLWCYIEDFRL